MKIYIKFNDGESFNLEVSPQETIGEVRQKAQKIKIFFNFDEIKFNGMTLNNSQSLDNYGIREGDTLNICPKQVGACIDQLKDEVDTKIGFDLSLIKRNELNINLIHFDAKMTNHENYGYYNKLKVDVVGGFYAIDNLEVLKLYLNKIKGKNIPFIVISSGSNGKDVIPICKQYSFIKEVIIFCMNYKYNEHYIKEYPGYVKKVFTSLDSVYQYLKTFEDKSIQNGIEKYKFALNEIKMDKQINQTPVITSSEYDSCYFLIHKSYAHFFKDINNKNESVVFNQNNINKLEEALNKINDDFSNKKNLLESFKGLLNISDNNTFIEKAIRNYTAEDSYCYLYNRIMRHFEPGLISFAYYMGPFLYGINKYVKENPSFAFSKDMTLTRNVKMSKIDFYLYKLNLGHIICFPSLTSTSSKSVGFKATGLSQKTCKNDPSEVIDFTFEIKYKHKIGNISPGIILEDKKGHDGNYISNNNFESEVLLFPFTFLRINKINSEDSKIEFEIVNRTSYIEYTLKNNVKNRTFFSNLD